MYSYLVNIEFINPSTFSGEDFFNSNANSFHISVSLAYVPTDYGLEGNLYKIFSVLGRY